MCHNLASLLHRCESHTSSKMSFKCVCVCVCVCEVENNLGKTIILLIVLSECFDGTACRMKSERDYIYIKFELQHLSGCRNARAAQAAAVVVAAEGGAAKLPLSIANREVPYQHYEEVSGGQRRGASTDKFF